MELGFNSIKKWLLDLIFPESCLGCGARESSICNQCCSAIRKAERETSRGIIAAYDYRDPIIKRAIWNLKYYKRKYLGQRLGEMLYESFLEDVADIKIFTKGQPIIVIPVPVSRTRKKMRGYNQAEIIAKYFCNCGEKEVFKLKTNLITKKVDTIPQARITNRVTRLKNINGAFELIHSESIKGETIIIIDDVTTTGGTITEIIKLLKSAGAKKVIGLTVAH